MCHILALESKEEGIILSLMHKKKMPSDTDVQNIDNCTFFLYITVCLFEVPIHKIAEISPPFTYFPIDCL